VLCAATLTIFLCEQLLSSDARTYGCAVLRHVWLPGIVIDTLIISYVIEVIIWIFVSDDS